MEPVMLDAAIFEEVRCALATNCFERLQWRMSRLAGERSKSSEDQDEAGAARYGDDLREQDVSCVERERGGDPAI